MKIIDIPKSVLTLLRNLEAPSASWPVPEPLSKPLLPVVKFDAKKLLPQILNDFCSDIAYRIQCPIDFIAVAVVSMLGSVIGAGCAVRPKQNDPWTEVPNLWGGVVGRPGQLKTPALNAAMGALRSLERSAQIDYDREIAAYNQTVLCNKMQSKLFEKNIKGSSQLTQDQIDKFQSFSKPSENPPRLRRYRSNDSTVEKLGEMLTTNNRGLLVFRDELVGLLKSFEQQGHEADRAFYLEAWNGQHDHRIDRIGRGEILVPRLCISLFGGIQPAKLQDYLYQSKLGGNDGLLQRFQLIVFPDEVSNPKIIDEEPNRVASAALLEIVGLLASTDFATVGAQQPFKDDIPYFRFEKKGAQPRFFAWLQAHDREPADDDNLIQEHFAKYRGLVPSLALIFQLFESASKNEKKIASISLRNLNLAIAWSEYLASHARRIYRMGGNPVELAAATLARKLTERKLGDGFSERDVHRKGWANLTDQVLANRACKELEAAGWTRRRQVKRGGAVGRVPSLTYDINPKIWKK